MVKSVKTITKKINIFYQEE